MPTRTNESETAASILRAAEEAFAARGYAGVSVRDIAERAGVNKALVFYHHGSKEKLLQTVLTGYYDEYAQALKAALAQPGSLSDRLHLLLDANLDFIEENSRYVRIVQIELAMETEHLQSIKKGMNALYRAVSEVLKGLTPASGPLASRHFFVSFSGMVNTYFLQADALEALWEESPLRVAALRERRQHLHWMLDAIVEGLKASA